MGWTICYWIAAEWRWSSRSRCLWLYQKYVHSSFVRGSESKALGTVEKRTFIRSIRFTALLHSRCWYPEAMSESASAEEIPIGLTINSKSKKSIDSLVFCFSKMCLWFKEISDENSEEKIKEKHRIQTRYAIDLFSNKCFKESMREFIKLETDPCDVIRLFPNLFPKESAATKLNQSALAKSNLPILDGKDLEMALLALIEYLTEVRFNLLRQIQNAESKPSSKNSNYLLSIIDTTLLKCYLQVNFIIPLPNYK